ncbi:hypothetical protein [Microbulbifer agarilyticus]
MEMQPYIEMRDFPGVDELDYLLRSVDPQIGPYDLWISIELWRLYLTPTDVELMMLSGPKEGDPLQKLSFFVVRQFPLGSPHIGPHRIYNRRLLRELNRRVWQRWESFRISRGHEELLRHELSGIDPELLRLVSPAFFFCDKQLQDLQEQHSLLEQEREILFQAISALSQGVDRHR